MHPKDGKVRGGSCLASACESFVPADAPAVDAELAAKVGLEFERYLEMRKAVRKLTGQRRRATLSASGT